MSIIVSVKKNGRTVVAADSLNIFGQERIAADNSRVTKVRPIGSALMGFTGWAVYANIIDDMLEERETPALGDEKQIFAFFMDMWKELHDRYPFVNDQAHAKDSPFGDLDASFLIVNADGIYKISEDASVCRFEKYYAIGSGGAYALGAIHQVYDGADDARAIARRGVQSAIEFDVYCGGEIDVFEVAPR